MMSLKPLFLALAAGGSAAALACSFGDGSSTTPQDDVVRSTCSTVLSGEEWDGVTPVEAQETIEAELAALDLSTLPEEIDISDLLPIYRGGIAWALEQAPASLGDTLDRDETAALGPLGEVVLAAILEGQSGDTGFDYDLFRRGLHRWGIACQGFPMTLDGFKEAIHDFTADDSEIVDSPAKCGDRGLYVNLNEGVLVAETVVDEGTRVRETEILVTSYRQDGQLDFLVYDEAGNLSNRSRFPTVEGDQVVVSAPYTCMTCHFDANGHETAWTYTVLLPEDTGSCQR